MKNSELSSQESLKDEVTTATLLKQVHFAIQAEKDNASSSKRQRSSSFRKCENAICSKAAINRPCHRHPKKWMMACSATCHMIAKTSNLATTAG
jgi:hypothetical protein